MKRNAVQISRRNLKGFTLIELMVVVAILAILTVAVVAVSTSMRGKAQITKTKQTLGLLKGIMDDYERDTDLKVGSDITPPSTVAIPDGDTKQFVQVFMNYPKTKDAIRPLISSDTSGTTVKDAFGYPIKFTSSPKRGFVSGGPANTGGGDAIYSWDAQ